MAVTALLSIDTETFSLSDSSVNLQQSPVLNIPPNLIWNTNVKNERQLQTNVTNDRSQSTVVTYLKCRGIVNNQMKKGLLLSLQVKKIKIGEYVAYL